MKFRWIDGLPFVSAALTVENQLLQFNNVLIDTGAASSVFCTDKLFEFGLGLQPTDISTRYDKLERNYRSMVSLAFSMMWLPMWVN